MTQQREMQFVDNIMDALITQDIDTGRVAFLFGTVARMAAVMQSATTGTPWPDTREATIAQFAQGFDTGIREMLAPSTNQKNSRHE